MHEYTMAPVTSREALSELKKFNFKTRLVASDFKVTFESAFESKTTHSPFLNSYEENKLSQQAKALYYQKLFNF